MNGGRDGRSPIYLIRRCHQIQDALFIEETAGCGLTSLQFLVLKAIDRFPGIEQTALAEYISYDVSTVGGVLERLVAKDFVVRNTTVHDRRRKRLNLTAAGEQILRATQKPGKNVERRLMEALSPAERRHLIAMLERVVAYDDASRSVSADEAASA